MVCVGGKSLSEVSDVLYGFVLVASGLVGKVCLNLQVKHGVFAKFCDIDLS